MSQSLREVNSSSNRTFGGGLLGNQSGTKGGKILGGSQAIENPTTNESLPLQPKSSVLKIFWFALRNPLFFFRSDIGKMEVSREQVLFYFNGKEDEEAFQKVIEYIDHTPMTDKEYINLLNSAISHKKNDLVRYTLKALSTETVNIPRHLSRILNTVKIYKNADALEMLIQTGKVNILDVMNNGKVQQDEYLFDTVVQQCIADQIKSADQLKSLAQDKVKMAVSSRKVLSYLQGEKDEKAFQKVIKYIYHTPMTDEEYINLLNSAISYKKNDVVRYTLDALSTETVNISSHLFRILSAVTQYQNADALKMLIQTGKVNILDVMNNAIIQQNEYLFDTVVQQCTDDQLKSVDEDDNTLLHVAAQYPNSKMIKTLIDRDVDVNAQNKAGKTPLQLANDAHVVELLKECGAHYKDHSLPWGYPG